ncbi:hypothetical protein [Roseibium alexandrii]|uniref:DUF5648 domain-containing protein n=1 Tax=Roseibium alexandrii (strain DSM 17067 / NCIMB 14079 / DFL-11) TaxID=244592 RepID=A0A5E8GTZ0_ROSAD|nr:hypothetical protein [Roseibium alexandrii]EEE43002.2 hypothetical protein SADFL11_288 [Roseibium alexandrii DFL-11]
MAVPRYPEISGELVDDTFFVSSYREYYGLSGNDTFWTYDYNYASLLSGGLGNDTYNVFDGAYVLIHDTGGTDIVRAIGTTLSDPDLYVAYLDNQHLLVANYRTQHVVAVADWFNPEKRIEYFEFFEGIFTYDQVNNVIQSAPNFLGNYSTDVYGSTVLGISATAADVINYVTSITQREAEITGAEFTEFLPDFSGTQGTDLVRFYNTGTDAFFYTANVDEALSVQTNLPYFTYQGRPFNVVDVWDNTEQDAEAIFRFLNQSTGGHFFTDSEAERDYIINNPDNSGFLANFRYEGAVFKAFDEGGAGRVAVHRLYDPETGSHALSTSEAEIVGLQANGFQYEHVAFWAYS